MKLTFSQLAGELDQNVKGSQQLVTRISYLIEIRIPRKYMIGISIKQLYVDMLYPTNEKPPQWTQNLGEKMKDYNDLLAKVSKQAERLWNNLQILSALDVPISFQNEADKSTFLQNYKALTRSTNILDVKTVDRKLGDMRLQTNTLQILFNNNFKLLDKAITDYEEALTFAENGFSEYENINYNTNLVVNAMSKLGAISAKMTQIEELIKYFLERCTHWILVLLSPSISKPDPLSIRLF